MTESEARPAGAMGTPPRKFLIRPLWLVGGLLWGAAMFILLQQYAVFVYSTGTLIVFALIGLALGLALPNVAAMIAAKKAHAPAPKEGTP